MQGGKGHIFRRFILIVLAIGTIHMSINCVYTVENIKVGDYGTITARSADHIKDAIVEKVVIYPQKGEHDPAKRIERNGVLVRYKDAIATVLICHGFMCDKFDVSFLRRLFKKGRYNVMSFDFRAHGEK